MNDPRARIEDAFAQWRAVRQQRRAGGDFKPSQDEVDALLELEAALDTAPEEVRSSWKGGADVPDEGTCRCGHHLAQHHEGERCLHPVGCRTVCGCVRWEGRD